MKNPQVDFAGIIRSLGVMRSRRQTLAALLGGLPGLFLLAGPAEVAAKRKRRNRHKNRRPNKKPKPCAAGDIPGEGCRCKKQGERCANDAQCCLETQNLSCQEGVCQPCDVCRSGCAFDSVQAALDAAVQGDTIQLCPGVFKGPLVVNQGPNRLTEVTLIGAGDGENGTTLDGDARGATLAISNATATLKRLRITGGESGNGGGISSQSSTLTLTECTVSGNSADLSGGGISLDAANPVTPSVLTLTDSTVADNKARTGGGIGSFGFGTVTLTTSLVRGNEAGQLGGGIFVNGRTAVTLNDSRIEKNTATLRGGGIHTIVGSGSTFTRNDSVVDQNSPDDCTGEAVC